MTVASVLARGRALAESLMTDTATIRRVTGSFTDPNTGVITPTYTTIYTGKCRVQQQTAQSRPENAGEAYVLLVRRELQLPVVGSESMRAGDEVSITAAAHDSALVGKVFRIREEHAKTHATSRRFGIEEVTG